MMMISSPPSQSSTQSDSAKRLRLTIPRTSKNDPLNHSNTMSPTKLDDKSSQKQKKPIDCTDTLTAMKQQLSNAIENENDTTLLTTTTTTTTVEVKVKTTKTSSSSSSSSRKRKLNVADEPPINTNADKNDNVSKQEQEQDQQPAVSKKKKKARAVNTEPITDCDSSPNDDTHRHPAYPQNTADQSSVTDESSFGSCEPGTSVILQGIVWNETDKGVLVVNITWRGKTYVGALLNTTEQNWAPPRYKSDVRPTKHTRHNHHHNSNRDYLSAATVSSASASTAALHVQPTSTHSPHEPAERILRNGKRRGPYTTVTSNAAAAAATRGDAFKIPEAPPSKGDDTSNHADKLVDGGSGAPSSSSTSVNDEDETNSISGEKTLVRNGVDDETGDNCSSRSVSPTTSGGSTTSSSPPPSIHESTSLSSALVPPSNEPTVTSIPIDLSSSRTATLKIEENTSYNSLAQRLSPSSLLSSSSSFLSSLATRSSKSKSKETLPTPPPSLLSSHRFNNAMLFSSPPNPASYYPPSFLHGPSPPFGLPPYHLHPHHHAQASAMLHGSHSNKHSPPSSNSSVVSPSSYLPMPAQLFFNSLTAPRYPPACTTSPSSNHSKSSR